MKYKYKTKDSGEREVYPSGLQKEPRTSKPEFILMLPTGMPYHLQMLTRVANLYTRGGIKYGRRNWEKAETPEELETFLGSAYRHLMQSIAGEKDEDHAAAVIFNIIAAEYIRWRIGEKQKAEKISKKKNAK